MSVHLGMSFDFKRESSDESVADPVLIMDSAENLANSDLHKFGDIQFTIFFRCYQVIVPTIAFSLAKLTTSLVMLISP